MTKYGYTDHKNDVLKRINRAEGQVRGIARMVEEDKYCIDILTQIKAAHAALDKVAMELIRDHTKHCMANASSVEEQSEKADELVGAINRMVTR